MGSIQPLCVAEGITSATGIAKGLNERSIPTTRGGRWQAVQEIQAAPCIVVRELTTELVNFSWDRTPFDARGVRRRGVGWVIHVHGGGYVYNPGEAGTQEGTLGPADRDFGTAIRYPWLTTTT
jgi:hypothetical protein